MPRSPPPRRLKLFDMRHGDREPTPESESPSPYCESPGMDNSESPKDSTDLRKKQRKDPQAARWVFPKDVSQENPFPWGLPHANRFGAIRSRPLIEEDALKLDPAPEVPRWRHDGGKWFFGPWPFEKECRSEEQQGDNKGEGTEIGGEKSAQKKKKRRSRSGTAEREQRITEKRPNMSSR